MSTEPSVLKVTTDKQLDAQDKRIQDVGLATTQQSNYLAAIANETANVGNYIGVTSLLITIISIAAGFIAYFSAMRQAQDEAKKATAQWFKENTTELEGRIEALKKHTEDAHRSITENQQRVDADTHDTLAHYKATRETVDNAAKIILKNKSESVTVIEPEVEREARATVRKVSEDLKSKAEISYTTEEHYSRGLSRYADGDYAAALESFEAALAGTAVVASSSDIVRYLTAKGATLGELKQNDQEIAVYDDIDLRFGEDTVPEVREQVVHVLLNKGYVLGQMGRIEQEIAVYEDIDRRFGKDTMPAVRAQTIMALNNMGCSQFMLAKVRWQDEIERRRLLSAAKHNLFRALASCTIDDLPIILANLGYVSHLIGDHEAARKYTQKSLRLGGKKIVDLQRDDAQKHRLKQEDRLYEKMLDELWETMNDAPTDDD
jgi:tetratricopeptide (TPR) repeat protein